MAQGCQKGRTKCLRLGEMTVDQCPPRSVGVAIRCFHLRRGTAQDQGVYTVSEVIFLAVTHLYPRGVQPVGDVADGHVHWQDDGLAVVVQAGGGALGPCGKQRGRWRLNPCLLMPGAAPSPTGMDPTAPWAPLVWAISPSGTAGKREPPPHPSGRATSGLPDDSLVSSAADTHRHAHRP